MTTDAPGFDAEALRARYRDERERRLRPDGLAQYVEVAGELAWLARHEMVLSLTDLLVRRTQLQYLAGDRLRPLLPELGRRLCIWLDLPVERAVAMVDEMAAYLDAREPAFLMALAPGAATRGQTRIGAALLDRAPHRIDVAHFPCRRWRCAARWLTRCRR